MSDLYAVLAVERGADTRTIRAAYRRLARRHHPDAGGDERQMIEVNEAWQTLSQPARRAAYDAQTDRPVRPERRTRNGHTVLDFGRYEGWSLADVAAHDDNYLAWLERTPIGRPLRNEINALLARGAAVVTPPRPKPKRPKWRWSGS